MHNNLSNLIEIQSNIKKKINFLNINKYDPKIIAVSKTFNKDDILPLLDFGHLDFGENKVQEAQLKWPELKKKYLNVGLHLLGKLQTNKVKFILPLFDYIHSLDSIKLASKISEQQIKKNFKPKIFIQVNIGDESQKSGIELNNLEEFYKRCVDDFKLDIIGLMSIPPFDKDPNPYFVKMRELSNNLNLKEISMGMSNDYHEAIKQGSTFIRIGSKIFGSRT